MEQAKKHLNFALSSKMKRRSCIAQTGSRFASHPIEGVCPGNKVRNTDFFFFFPEEHANHPNDFNTLGL